MDRNIITPADRPRASSRWSPRSGPTARTDDYWGRLAKYTPIEMISAYLVLKGLLESAYGSKPAALAWSLLALFLLGVLGSWFFAASVLRVVRRRQLVVTSAAFAVWGFATGGWFATMSWYDPWMGTAAVVIFAVVVKILAVPPLPNESP